MPVHVHISVAPRAGALNEAYQAADTFTCALHEQGFIDASDIALAADSSLLLSILCYSHAGADEWPNSPPVAAFWGRLLELLAREPRSARFEYPIPHPSGPPELEVVECDPRADGCEELELQPAGRCGEPPLRCLSHDGLVSLHILGPGGTGTLLQELQGWAREYGHIHNLWLQTGEYERWAAAELSGPQSSINRRGAELAMQLTAHLGIDVEFNPMTRDETHETELDQDISDQKRSDREESEDV